MMKSLELLCSVGASLLPGCRASPWGMEELQPQ